LLIREKNYSLINDLPDFCSIKAWKDRARRRILGKFGDIMTETYIDPLK
jgi:hypothetical protein